MFEEFSTYDAIGLAELVKRRHVSAAELLQASLSQVERFNPRLGAVVHLEVEVAERSIAAGLPEGPFTGVPFLLKDLGAEAIDFPTSMGSRLFKDTRHTFDSEIYLRLERSGLVTYGRTASPEFGIGATTEAQAYGAPTRNPWNLEHTSGGSSGGAASAVAAGILPAAHGSDGGGSVRIPASSCGLFGLKPTRARLPDGPASGEGWAGMAIDGFLTRSVRDTAALIDATHGPDLGAPYLAPAVAWPFLAEIEKPPRRLKIAYTLKSFTGAALDYECATAVGDAATLLDSLGHDVEEAAPKIDILDIMRAFCVVVASGVLLSVRARQAALGRDVGADELEPSTHGALAFARTLTGADYLAAVNTVHATGRTMAAFMQDYDVLVTPTLAEPPARLGRIAPRNPDFLDYRLGPHGIIRYSPFTAVFNASGQPAMSVPLHWTKSGLPVGVHFAGRFGDDAMLLQLAAELEQAKPWFEKRPVL